MTHRSPSRCSKTSPGVIRLAVMLHVRVPLSARSVEDLLDERGNDGAMGRSGILRANRRGKV